MNDFFVGVPPDNHPSPEPHGYSPFVAAGGAIKLPACAVDLPAEAIGVVTLPRRKRLFATSGNGHLQSTRIDKVTVMQRPRFGCQL